MDNKKRATTWICVPAGHPYLTARIGDYYKAFVRILTVENCTQFNQYFQCSYYKTLNSASDFISNRIYTDEEEADIKATFPNIIEHHKFKC